jgi:hypothetical protein
MQSQSSPGEANRRRADQRFKSASKADSKAPQGDGAVRQAEVEKTARLRALRLAKEAADKDTANRVAAAAAAAATTRKTAPRRRGTGPVVSNPPQS